MNNDQGNPTDDVLLRSWQGFLRRHHQVAGGDPDDEPALDRLAEGLLIATQTGDPCLLPGLPVPSSPVISTIDRQALQQRWLENPPTTPLVLDRGLLYLQRLWLAEQRVAQQILEINRRVPVIRAVGQPIADVQLPGEQLSGEQLSAEQARALQIALSRSLLLLTGGPGTGKTHTLARILVALAKLEPTLRIAIAAPTGKAAARLSQALTALQPGQAWTVQTVHALLGARGVGNTNRHNRDWPLPHDVVVIDEASMLGLELAESLLSAVGPSARLILAGDADQLSSVEPGNVFADLMAAGSGPLADAALRLTHNYRQKEHPEIAELAAAVQSGDHSRLVGLPFVLNPAERPAVLIDRAVSRYGPLLAPLGQAEPGQVNLPAFAISRALELLDLAGQYRMLTALRTGPWGSVELAEAIDRRLSGRADQPRRSAWYNGRLVTLTRNLRLHGLANGDIGVGWILDDMAGVVFDCSGGPQWLPVSQLPGLEPAWCLTVHKAQGSEFNEVDLVLAPSGHALARRELVYTGVTRARRAVTLWGDAAALYSAMATPVQRRASLHSSLLAMSSG